MSKRYIAGALVSIASLALFFIQVPIGDMFSLLRQIDLVYLVLSIAAYALSYIFRALRWQILLQPIGAAPFYSALSALVIGFMGNNLLPAHLGEFIRAYVLKHDKGYDFSATMASIVLERLFDGLTALLFLVIVLMYGPLPDGNNHSIITIDMLRKAGWGAGILFGGMLFFLQLFRWKQDWSISQLTKILNYLPDTWAYPVLNMFKGFIKGLGLVRIPSLLAIAATSILTWVMLALYTWFLFPAFGVDLSFMAAMLVQVGLVLALLIPAAPGAIGTFHLAAANILILLGIQDGLAGSIAMTIWLIHYLMTNVAGLFFIWEKNLGWKALSVKPQSF